MYKEIHKCKVTTLKNQKRFSKRPVKKYVLLFSQHISNLQCQDKDGYYQEVANDQRGGIPKINGKSRIIDIACAPRNIEDMKQAFISIIKEKSYQDLACYNALVEQMKKDGKITEKQRKELGIDSWEIASTFIVPTGLIVEDDTDKIKIRSDLKKLEERQVACREEVHKLYGKYWNRNK